MTKYRNRFEASVGKQLDEAGVKAEYESERLPYTINADYVPDFIITTKSGRKLYIETKGNGRSFDASVRRKLIAVKEAHPDKDIRLVFWANGKFGPSRSDGSRQSQTDWADRHQFKWAVGGIPDEWLE